MSPYLIGLITSGAVLAASALVWRLAGLWTKGPSWVRQVWFISLVVALLSCIAVVVFSAIVVLMASAGKLR